VRYECQWDECTHIQEDDLESFKDHLRMHARELNEEVNGVSQNASETQSTQEAQGQQVPQQMTTTVQVETMQIQETIQPESASYMPR